MRRDTKLQLIAKTPMTKADLEFIARACVKRTDGYMKEPDIVDVDVIIGAYQYWLENEHKKEKHLEPTEN